MNPRPIDLENLLTVMSELYQPCMNEKGLRLELRILGPVTVQGDPALLHRAVANLFDNELKHLPTSRTITLSLSAEQATAVLSLEDDGPGFPPDIVEDVFKPRVKGRTSTGLGLGRLRRSCSPCPQWFRNCRKSSAIRWSHHHPPSPA